MLLKQTVQYMCQSQGLSAVLSRLNFNMFKGRKNHREDKLRLLSQIGGSVHLIAWGTRLEIRREAKLTGYESDRR